MQFQDEFWGQWRKYYNKIHWFGRFVNEARKNKGDEKLPPEDLKAMEQTLKNLTTEARDFMDKNHCRMPKPKWHYNGDDPATWSGHFSFKFKHLL